MACVRKRRVGKGYRWVLDYRDQQGRRHWETTKGNRKEAERLLAERVRQISRGTYQAPTERVSFEDLAQAYLKYAEGNLRENTLRDYRCNVNLHLLPYFQGWKLRDIRRKQVEELRGKLLESGVGPSTVNKCLTLLGALFRYAIRHEYIEANPAEGTKLRASSRRSHDLVEANSWRPSRSKRFSRPLMPAGA
jgi:integrase